MTRTIRRPPAAPARPLVICATAVLLVCGCARFAGVEQQRTTHGPTAEQMWTFRVANENGREPTFEEKNYWDDHLDRRISAYLNEHPEVANSLDVSDFRFSRQTLVGMTREQVTILLGPPDAVVTDPAAIEKLARRYWPLVKGHASEAWVYPLGWRLYFSDARLVDITQYLPKSGAGADADEGSR